MQEEFEFEASNEKEAAPRDKKKRWRRPIVLGVIALLFVAVLVTSLIILSTPKMRIARSLGNAVEDLAERPEVEPLLTLLESGSIEASLKGEGLSASGKLYINIEELRAYAEDIELNMNGNTYHGEAYIGPDSIYVSSRELLNGSLGIQAGSSQQAWDELWGSAKKTESYYGASGLLELYDEEQVAEFLEDYAKISKANTKMKLELALEYGNLTEEKKEQRIGEKKMKVRVYRLVLDEDALQSIDAIYLEYLEDSEDLREFLHKYERFFVNIAGKDADVADVDELFEEYINNERERTYESKSYSQKYVLQLTTKSVSAEALGFMFTKTVDYKDSDYSYTSNFSIECDEDGFADAQKLKFCFDETDVVYEIKENTKKKFVAKLTSNDKYRNLRAYLTSTRIPSASRFLLPRTVTR